MGNETGNGNGRDGDHVHEHHHTDDTAHCYMSSSLAHQRAVANARRGVADAVLGTGLSSIDSHPPRRQATVARERRISGRLISADPPANDV